MSHINKKNIIFFGMNIIIPLLAGVFLYIWMRPDTYISIYVYNFLDLSVNDLKFGFSLPHLLSSFLRNFSCDMLWAYSLTFTVFVILGLKYESLKPTLIICSMFEIGIELLQKFGVISGTFDFLDILLEFCIIIFAIIVIFFTLRRVKNEKE